MNKILGLDLGTNSIGWLIRNTDSEIKNQIEKFGVAIFAKGVGEGKSGEFSFAAERTKNRSGRRLYQARKYRLWKTLEILIKNDYCPLSFENLDRWRKYDKINAQKGEGGRCYPVNDMLFDAWIKLDFNVDGKPDYISPYQLRAELIEKKLNFDDKNDRYKLGRALYHIAQRRGFKSSRKDAQPSESGEKQDAKSELKKESFFEKSLQEKYGKSLSDFPTIGSALCFIEQQGDRVRLEWIQYTFRKHYKDECTKIFEFQGIGINSDLYKKLIETSRNRYNGSIFFQRPLRSQKGLVGKCTLEPDKYRCPVSHPEFEEFRALSLLNNIQYKAEGEWVCLPDELKKEIYGKLFFRISKANFHFSEIRELIEKKLNQKFDYHKKTINYSDKTNISACPVSAYLKEIFGEDWKNINFKSNRIRKNQDGVGHVISYAIEDVWHILFSFEDEELVTEFAKINLGLDEKKTINFIKAWNNTPVGYAMLSLNAIKKINVFLREGFIYTEAVLLANIPEIIGIDTWKNQENQQLFKSNINKLIKQNRQEKQLLNIVNNLVAQYKSLDYDEQYGYKDPNYTLTDSNKEKILETIIEVYGEKTWSKNVEKKETIVATVNYLYQCIFRNGFETILIGDERYHIIKYNGHTYYKSTENQFYKLPRVIDEIKDFIRINFPDVNEKQIKRLYHPSMIEVYPLSTPDRNDGKLYLPSPKTGAFKNPMAMRTLFELRKLMNYLIRTGQIDEETRIVVETARELNDANKRWAIDAYQRQRQSENKEFADAIRGLLENNDYTTPPNPDSSNDIDKVRIWYEQAERNTVYKGKGDYSQNKWANQTTELLQKLSQTQSQLDKYRLWNEQKCICMYTGKIISISDLFDENKVDFEHTVPRSLSFDNSLANLTVCYANYNRNIKKNQIPTQLPNYEKEALGYPAIKPRLKDWEEKVEHLKANIEFWKGKSKASSNKDYKDEAIRQRHLWQMELDYWQNKLNRFTMKEVTSGFKNSQLVDTQLISKYAYHYLRAAFNTVDVQKGAITADFRKILGIQKIYEKKSREKHSHHAIDAAILTLIPHAAQRDKILTLFYQMLETKSNENHEWLTNNLNREILKLKLPNVTEILDTIDSNILINNVARDRALIPAKKIVRRRDKIVYLRDKNRNLILDENGKPKPMIAQGDCIRGQLHKETFFGAIKEPLRDELSGNPLKEDGQFIYEKERNGNDKITMVVKTLISDFSTEKELNSIIDPRIRYSIQKTINNGLDLGLTFKDAINKDIWLLDKNDNPIKTDKNGKFLCPIRHVRCKVAAGRGFMTKEKSLILKHQTYLSKHEYKQWYYAQNADNYLYLLYEAYTDKGLKRNFRIINYLEASQISIKNAKELFENPYYLYLEKGSKKTTTIYKLSAIIKTGTKVLVKSFNEEELTSFSTDELSKRLYKVYKFNDMNGTGYLYIQHHLEARMDKELGDGDTIIDIKKYQARLKLASDKFDCFIESKDFEIKPDGEIRWL